MTNEELNYKVPRNITIGMGTKFADVPPHIGRVTVDEAAGITTAAAITLNMLPWILGE